MDAYGNADGYAYNYNDLYADAYAFNYKDVHSYGDDDKYNFSHAVYYAYRYS